MPEDPTQNQPEVIEPDVSLAEVLLHADQTAKETHSLLENQLEQDANTGKTLELSLEAQGRMMEATEKTKEILEDIAQKMNPDESDEKSVFVVKGKKGDKGDTGEKGDKGEPGEKGEIGPTGENGLNGEQGPRGEKGDKGEKGERGDDGKNGQDGKNGKDGKNGRDGIYQTAEEVLKLIRGKLKYQELDEESLPNLSTFRSRTSSKTVSLSELDDVDLSALTKVGGKYVLGSGTGTGSVTSVFGRAGDVTATLGDYTTTLVTEGTNLYYTAARFNTAFAAKTTTDLAEGTNLYYTTARFDTAFATKTTSDLAEGSRLYFTNARSIGSTLTGYTSGAGTISALDSVLSAIQKLNGNIGALVTGVSSVASAALDTSLTITPTTGAVTAKINLSNANTWVGQQTFSITAPKFSTTTAGSIYYAGVSGILTEDNSNFFIDNTNKRMGIGLNSALSARVQIKGEGATSATKALLVQNSTPVSIFTVRNDGIAFMGTPTTTSLASFNSIGFEISLPSTATSNACLILENQRASAANTGALMLLMSNDGAALANGDRLGQIGFSGSKTAAAMAGVVSSITAFATEAWSNTATGSDMRFNVALSGQTTTTERWRIANQGNLSNLAADGSAQIHLKAGGTGTSTAPFKFTAGGPTTTAAAGQLEYSGSFYLTNNAGLRSGIGGSIYDFTTDSSVGGTEADIYTSTTPASTLGVNGEKLIAEYGGNFVTVGTELTQLKVYFGGTAIWDSTGVAPTTGTTSWRVYVEIIRVSATVVRYTVSLNTTGASGFVYCTVGELTGLTLSNTNILKITGQSSGVGSGAGDIVGKMGYVRWNPAAIL